MNLFVMLLLLLCVCEKFTISQTFTLILSFYVSFHIQQIPSTSVEHEQERVGEGWIKRPFGIGR